jgi:hypothetical protein
MIQPSIVADLAPTIQSREAADPETYPSQTMHDLFESGVIGGPHALANRGGGGARAAPPPFRLRFLAQDRVRLKRMMPG